MRLKIIFSEPPEQEFKAEPDQKLVVIPSPYKVLQDKLGDTRGYVKLDGSKMPEDFSYELYCEQMKTLIRKVLDESKLSEFVYHQIYIQGFSEPPNFKALCSILAKLPISCVPSPRIIFKSCNFGGKLYTDSASQLITRLQQRHFEEVQKKLHFKVFLFDPGKFILSKHDEARLAMLEDVLFIKNNKPILKTIRDDSLIGIKPNRLLSRLVPPTFFFQSATTTLYNQTTAEVILKNFFSEEAQQQNDYTCGPVVVKEVAGYLASMQKQNFCGAPIEDPKLWQQINQTPEMILAEKVNTNEADGSSIPEIRKGLMRMGVRVFDDIGLSDKEYDKAALKTHKSLLWDKMHQILQLGIPLC